MNPTGIQQPLEQRSLFILLYLPRMSAVRLSDYRIFILITPNTDDCRINGYPSGGKMLPQFSRSMQGWGSIPLHPLHLYVSAIIEPLLP